MSDLQSWGKACESAYKQPLSQLITTNWGMAGFVIASFLISAGASLWKFLFWFRASHEERKAMWHWFVHFAACCFTANLSGAIAFLANALMLDQFFSEPTMVATSQLATKCPSFQPLTFGKEFIIFSILLSSCSSAARCSLF